MASSRRLTLCIPILAVLWLPSVLFAVAEADSVPATQESADLVLPKAPVHDTNAAANEKFVTDGMTFGDLVKYLGPGTTMPGTEAGELRWYFDDDAVLAAQSSNPDDVMHLGTGAKMWWVNPPGDGGSQSTSPQPGSRQRLMSAVTTLRADKHSQHIIVMSAGGVVLVLLLIALRWYSVVRTHRRAVAGRLFRANKRLPALPWGRNLKDSQHLGEDATDPGLQ